jgi:hypothetical protein
MRSYRMIRQVSILNSLCWSQSLRSPAGNRLNINDRIVAERFGGKIKYPSGQTIRWGNAREGIPIVGKRYIFFLSKVDQDTYELLTAYEIVGYTVSPLDGSRIEPGGRQGASIFDKHNGESLDSFMAQVDKAINNSKEGSRRP